jgi:hypothetical protein
VTTGSVGVLTVAAGIAGGTAACVGGVADAAGATTGSAGVLTVAAGTAGGTAVCAGVVAVAAGAAVAAAGILVWSVLVLAAGVCANPSATSRTGTTISRNTRFMESSEKSHLAAV